MKKLEKYLYFQLLKKTKGKQMHGNKRLMGMGYTTEGLQLPQHTVLPYQQDNLSRDFFCETKQLSR